MKRRRASAGRRSERPPRPSKHRRPTAIDLAREIVEPPETARHATIAAWVVIAAFAAVLAVIVVGPHRIGAFDVESDFYGGYAPAALALQHGHLLGADGKLPAVFGFVGPLYPLLLALGGLALGDVFRAAEWLSVVAGVAAVVFWFLLLRRRAGGELGLVVVLLLASNPLLVRFGYSVTSDTTALAFQSAALFVLFSRAGRGAAAGAGLLVGLATLTRYTSVYLIPAGLVAIGMGATRDARRRPAAFAYVLGFLALVLPWQVYGRLHGAEVQFHQLLAYDVYGDARGVSWDDFLLRIWPRFEHSPLAVFSADPGAVARRLLANLGGHLLLDARLLLGWPIAILALLAAPLALLDRGMLRLVPLALAGVWAFLALIPAAHNARYSLAVLPFYLLLAGATLTSGAWLAVRRRGPVLVRWAVVGVVVAMSLVVCAREQRRILDQQPFETLACAERLKHLARPGDRVIARKPNVAFHAGVGFVYFPPLDSLEGLARDARANGARWLFVSRAEVQLRPAFTFLLDTTATVPGLTLREYTSMRMRVRGRHWQGVCALYEIGPGFGRSPDWFADDRLRELHMLRGQSAFDSDARASLRLARIELLQGNFVAAQSAWRNAARIDPRGMAILTGRFGGDTIRTVEHADSLFE